MKAKTWTAAAVAGALLLAAIGVAAAKDETDDRRGPKPGFHSKGGKWVLQNDHIAVWFHAGKEKAKPDIRVALNSSGDDEASGYRVKILRVCEVPANGTGCSGSMPRIDLARADDWNVVSEEAGDELILTMTRAEAQGIVKLVWHLDTVNATVKFDLVVDHWRWQDEGNRLALDMLVIGRDLKNATGATVNVEEAGYISWADTASASYANGSTGNLTVDAVKKGSRDSSDEEGSGSHLVLVFNGAGGYQGLAYDPTFGVTSSSATPSATPGLGVLVIVAAAVGAAHVLTRRRP